MKKKEYKKRLEKEKRQLKEMRESKKGYAVIQIKGY